MDDPGFVDVAPDGDVVLEVTFDTSKETLKLARKAAPRLGQKGLKAEQTGQQPPPPVLKARVKQRYRVQLDVLKQNSRYFNTLLNDTRFSEGRSIEAAFQQLSLKGVKPAEADPNDLPVVNIHEDDEASQSAGQEIVFGDLLRVLHRKPIVTKPVSMHYLALIAVLADRFDCTTIVSRWLKVLRYKWPDTKPRASTSKDDGPALTKASEDTLRQKILVSWLLDDPPRFEASTHYLVIFGSRKWAAVSEEEEQAEAGKETIPSSAWWHLPEGLEEELLYRRECILNTVFSIQRHFISLYSSRAKIQCQRGYDNSISCDAFQLGEMIRFFSSKGLLFLVDGSPSSLDAIKDFATVDINHIIAIYKQCPSYQIDKNHTNCGLRTQMAPILRFMEARLLSSAVAISRNDWATNRQSASWSSIKTEKGLECLWRRDQRLEYDGIMGAGSMTRDLFTADKWDWTPLSNEGIGRSFGNMRFA
ncbi:hypothetical protein QBC38DRAFT_133607 [Podospora fimiseda]|uniref:Hydroxyproline-rich glyco protein n=1 Tax=Podospora fimiseda TaxID=252190 RepID=A0AAN7BT11_9PEZI|nr:hypothetical protein QBC38DRAFT_133607 [Podospora fimiseda]